MMKLIFEIAVFLLGLCVGSFINMAWYRVKNRKSFFKDQRSFCDFCKKKLRWYDNIPVLSWFLYGGQSRCCKKKLPLLYPIVEISTGILFLLNFYYSTTYLFFFLTSLILGLLVFEAVFDFKEMLIPDSTAFSLITLALISNLFSGNIFKNIISSLGAAIFIFGLHKLKIKGQEAMGDGDILLAAFMGLFLGFPNIIVAFYIAFISGALVGVFLIGLKKVKRLSPVPFGPFLILGTVISFWWGENIIKLII